MKHISVLVPSGESILSSIVGPFKIFNACNQFISNGQNDIEPAFKVELVGLRKDVNLYGGAFSVHPHKLIHEVDNTDLIVIPAIKGDILKELESNNAFFPWIRQQYTRGAEVASLCMGSFILASTGLVAGKNCTTHWMGANSFKQMFPDVKLVEEKIITDENGVYSSGGAYSFLNLILHLVEKYCGREIALMVAKQFEIEIDRNDQSHFSIFQGQKDHADEQIKRAQNFIENNFEERISVDRLAEMFALSRRNFVRRFKKATANTPIEYIQRVKIEAAKKSLESSPENVNEVKYSVGYSDNKTFRKTFKKYTGLSPTEYRNKYNRRFARTS